MAVDRHDWGNGDLFGLESEKDGVAEGRQYVVSIARIWLVELSATHLTTDLFVILGSQQDGLGRVTHLAEHPPYVLHVARILESSISWPVCRKVDQVLGHFRVGDSSGRLEKRDQRVKKQVAEDDALDFTSSNW